MSQRKFLVLGAGMMGRAVVFDLVQSHGKDCLSVIDANKTACDSLRDWLDIEAHNLDAKDNAIDKHINDSEAIIVALPYGFNLGFMKKAISAGAHFCDLGGNDDIVSSQLALDNEAKKAGVLCLPDCGLAPGMADVLGAYLVSQFEAVEELTIRVGGLPQHPVPPLNYQLVFSVGGLINEYKEKCKVLRDGKITLVEPMDEVEDLEFDGIGKLEAFTTSGGAAWLPEIYQGKIDKLDYKTIRYPGHAVIFQSILKLGLADENEIAPGITPRKILEGQIVKTLSGNDEDLVLVRITVTGNIAGQKATKNLDIVERYDRENNITAMMRMTAYPTSIIAQMIVDGRIPERGVMTPEMCVPGDDLLNEMAGREITAKEY
ncbi:MAG: saccharopine dehydrogenase C-terminal domain-containing protein [Thermoplasmata archaeon]|nr:saccharopine dehydrogenase C-terminal domain-containing protein [Thermoplasmata archaeon]